MVPPSRTRRIAKWSGLVVCDVLLSMWAVSTVSTVARLSEGGHFGWRQGVVRVNIYEPPTPRMGLVTWIAEWTPLAAGLKLPELRNLPRDHVSFTAPLWLLFTLAAIPTALLWHRDRRTVKPSHCRQCGYDLRASKKKCPECGTAILRQEQTT